MERSEVNDYLTELATKHKAIKHIPKNPKVQRRANLGEIGSLLTENTSLKGVQLILVTEVNSVIRDIKSTQLSDSMVPFFIVVNTEGNKEKQRAAAINKCRGIAKDFLARIRRHLIDEAHSFDYNYVSIDEVELINSWSGVMVTFKFSEEALLMYNYDAWTD